MLNKQALLQNVNQPEERLLLAKVLDQAIFSLKKHENTFTDFCDPKKMETIIKEIQSLPELNFFVFGGNESCERRRIGFCPDYKKISDEEFPIEVVKISYNTKFSSNLTHRDYLGSILGLGIDRGKVGDILIFPEFTIAYIAEEVSGYVSANLERIGRTSVKAEVCSIESFEMPETKTEEKSCSVSSLRLDALVGAAFNMSRGKTQDLIEGEKVYVNWVVANNNGKQLKDGDMISVRGFGRAKINEIGGKTKKDRIIVTFLKYV